MDTEESSDFKSLREKFDNRSCTLPAYTKAREEELIPPKISRIRFNPELQGVINTLENQVRSVAPPIAKKPELPAKPNGLSKDMKLTKGFRQTFHFKDSKRTEGDGMCASSPQMYRHSVPISQDPPPMANQPTTQEVYEDVGDSAWPIPPTINNLQTKGSKPLPAPAGPYPVKMTSSPILHAAKDKKKKVNEVPPLKSLPSTASLGPAPSKPSRPLNVDLRAFFTLQQNGVGNEPEESAEGEYEQPAPSPNPSEGDVYDEAFSPKGSTESDSNVYEVDDGDNEYDMPEAANPAPDTSSPNETDEMLCYQDVLNLRESQYSSNVYDTEEINPVSNEETACTYEVSDDNNDPSYSSIMSSYPSIKSSVSEGYYSADLDTSSESFKSQENKSKEVKLGKNEQAFRKKFKISGQEKMIYTSPIIEDFKYEKYSLSVKKGDSVEVIQITDCPVGKWLARDAQGNHGFVPVVSLQVNSEIQVFSNQKLFPPPADQDQLYADIEARPRNSGGNADTLKRTDSYDQSDDQYDDISNVSQTLNSSGGKGKGFGHLFRKDRSKKDDLGYAPVIPTMNRTSQESEEYHTYTLSDEQEREKEEKSPGWKAIFHKNREQKGNERKFFPPASGLKKFTKEEKIFREKFKYTGEIKILNIAIINDLAPLSPKDKLELAVKLGETVEVLDVTTDDQIVCRNFSGKYGYVPIKCLNFSN